MLRVVAEHRVNAEGVELLPRGPFAEAGSLFHKAIELWQRREISNAADWLRERLDSPSPSGARYSTLRQALPATHVSQLSQRLERLPPHEHTATGMADKAGATAERLSGPEVTLESADLQLRGRADFIEIDAAGTVTITDYKTGSVRTPEGNLKPDLVLQLRAYALIYLEKQPDAKIRLALDNGEVEAVTWRTQDASTTRHQVRNFLAAARRVVANPEDAARPGADCARCRVRPSCRRYLTTAPGWWHDTPSEIGYLPLDTWGEVTSREPDADSGTVTLTLTDSSGRLVQVRGIDIGQPVASSEVGRTVWIFELGTRRRLRGFRGERPHPKNFYEITSDGTPARRAWTMMAYLE